MCTSIVSNRKKTIVGWNLDILGMEYRVRPSDQGVFIEILDKIEGWMPLFGVNSRGDFIGMPTCWPYDPRSDRKADEQSIIMLDIDILLQRRSFKDAVELVKSRPVCSEPGITYMSSISDAQGNVLHIIPGQGYKYYERPEYVVLTNFSPFKGDSELHPWMGMDRYNTACEMLKNASPDFDAEDCFEVLRAVSQTACPTVVSMVYDASERKVFWCTERQYQDIQSCSFI